ncbi:MAG TPA: class I adenylate-forming enzyme family protein [Mycobacteriales bacterium]|nr:class I adenylate-forming enzyme family protein [Mycobacteriales bacterium]
MPELMHRGLEAAADSDGDSPALLAGDEQWTYHQLDRASSALARHLRPIIAPRDRVVVMTANRPEFVIAVTAISKLGAAAVLVSPAWKEREVDHAVALTGATFAVGDGGSAGLLRERLAVDRVLDLDDRVGLDAVLAGDATRPDFASIEPSDEAVLVFSSGTTGLPKAVRHSHESIGHGAAHWVAALGLGPDDRFQVATPPSHILGLLNLLAAQVAGATVRLHRRFDLDEVLRRIQDERMTLEMAVAPIALAMADHPSIEDYDLSSLRYIMWGATPVTPSVAERVTERTGVRWLAAYGASEVPVIAANPVSDPSAWRLDSAGLPPAGITLRVVDLDSGAVLPAGEVGEIQIMSPSTMLGYLPAADSAAAFSDGWYRTGDVGWLEAEGWVHLTDRAKEMIKVKGFQVAPAEIEEVLHGHPGVRDCAVFGVPDALAGELPVAAVALDPEHPVSLDELTALVASELATYKALAAIVEVDEIPRLPSGKVLRRTLAEAWTAGPAGGDPIGAGRSTP